MKKYNERITFEVAKKRFEEQGRTDISLCEEGYVGWKKKSKFYDLIIQDYFWSIPHDVLRHNIVHPNRRMKKKIETNLKKFGVEQCNQCEELKKKISNTHKNKSKEEKELIFQKTKRTNLEKYGVEFCISSNVVKTKSRNTKITKYGDPNYNNRDKTRKTLLETHGVDNVSKITEVKLKKEKTSLSNWGCTQPLASKEVRIKGIETSQKKYGTDHPMYSAVVRNKIKKTCLEKYGTKHFFQSQFYICKKQKLILETNQKVTEWLKQQELPKPSIASINFNFKGEIRIPQKELEGYLIRFRSNKSNLEFLCEELFDIKHFDKCVSGMRYRPDFKINETTYLNADGLYWHSEKYKSPYYHFNLRKEFLDKNLVLFQFREDEIKKKPEIVKSIVNSFLYKPQNIFYSNECELKKVTQKEAIEFLNKNHLSGYINTSHIGLYFKKHLICILSYKFLSKKRIYHIERYSGLLNSNIIGGFNKLLNHLEKICLSNNNINIQYTVDLRYEFPEFLLDMGFKSTKEFLDWKWTDCYSTFDKHINITKLNSTQMFKIYDAGKTIYVKTLY